MRRFYSLVVVLVAVLVFSFPVAGEADGKTEFEIDTINGEDASRLNEVSFHRGAEIEIGLEGADITADPSNGSYRAEVGGETHRVRSDEGVLVAEDSELEKGKYTMKLVKMEGYDERDGEENPYDTTEIEIVETEYSRENDGETVDDGSTAEKTDFQIDKVAGQDTDQVNDLDLKIGERVNLELEGARLEDHRFTAYIAGEEFMVDDGGIVIVSDVKKVGTGEHELELEYYHSGEGTSTATTKVNIENIEDRRNRAKSPPGEFEIGAIAGEDADRLNKVKLSEGDFMDVELDNIDPGKYRFKAYIDGVELPVTDEGIMMSSKISEIGEGEHDLRIASIFEGEETTSAETEVEVTDVETRRDRRKPEELDSELYNEDFDPGVDGVEVDRGDGEITVTVTGEGLENDGGKIVVGDSIEDVTELELNFRRGLGGQGDAARLKVEEKDPGTVENSDLEVYAVLELSGQNLELVAPNIRYAVKDDWADKHGFDQAIRERGGGRQNTEIGFYDVEEDWKRFDARLYDTTPSHSIYGLYPRRIDQDFGLESKENTLVIGGNPEGGITYAEGPQGQCQSFKTSEDVPPGWNRIDRTCAEMEELQRERERLEDNIKSLKQDLKENQERGEKEDIEKLDNALDQLEKGNIEKAEDMYEEVQDKTAKSFLRQFIIKTVKDVFPF